MHEWFDEIQGRIAADCIGWDHDHVKYKKQARKTVKALKIEDAGRTPVPIKRMKEQEKGEGNFKVAEDAPE